jgi:DNA-binding response OmpR family regulator
MAAQPFSVVPSPSSPSAGEAVLRLSTPPGTAPRRKALLLEDDATFREILQAYLCEQGMEVVSVQNGVEGVHEVLASDFDAIITDMQMPTLPGDMFYRAVERMRPHLCERFIFMTGYRGNAKVNDFVVSVGGIMLMKPFQMGDLEELLAFIELRSMLLAAA